MAKIELGILGPFRGKVGNVIGYVRNGVWCVRSMPTHYYDRRSAAQLKNRNRFTMVMKVMSAVRPAITLGFKRFASAMTEMNVATRVNYYSLVQEEASGLVYSFDGLTLSRGPVERLDGVMMRVTGRDLTLVWDGNELSGGGKDLVCVAVVNGKRMEMRMWRGAARRGDGNVRVTLPNGWKGEECYCYVMIERDGEWSESEFVGDVKWEMVGAVGENGDGEESDAVKVAGDEVGTWAERGLGGDVALSDQSAIKVLSKCCQSRGGEGVEIPPGRGE